nr:hypothetical protein [Candidatus Sigynarchaeota archaeon]
MPPPRAIKAIVVATGTTIDLGVFDTNGITQCLYRFEGTATNTSMSSPYDVSLPSSDGSQVLHIYAIDPLGNTRHGRFVFTVDGTAPVVTLNALSNNSALKPGTTIDVGVSDPSPISTVLYHWDSDAFNTTWNSPYDLSLLAGEGIHNLHVYANDSLGNHRHVVFHFITDGTPPSITLVTPSNGSSLASGTTINLEIYDVNNLAQVLYHWDHAGNSTFVPPFDVLLPTDDKIHELHVYARDMAGNALVFVFQFTTDDTGPLFTINSPANNTRQRGGVLVDLYLGDASGIAQVLYNWDDGSNLTMNNPYDVLMPSEPGIHVLHVFAQDLIGNWNDVYYKFIVFDASQPFYQQGWFWGFCGFLFSVIGTTAGLTFKWIKNKRTRDVVH